MNPHSPVLPRATHLLIAAAVTRQSAVLSLGLPPPSPRTLAASLRAPHKASSNLSSLLLLH